MKLIISFCAPAVIESIATTAPTPKIMPSMVSRLRSLWAKRLASPIFNSGSMWEPIMLFPSRHAAHGAAPTGFLVGILALFVLVGIGVGQGEDLARLDSRRQHHGGFTTFH